MNSLKGNIIKKSLILLSVFNVFQVKTEEAGTIVAAGIIGAGAVGVGIGISKLFSNCFSSGDNFIDTVFKEVLNSKQFTKQLEIMDQKSEKLTGLDKKEILFTVDEELNKKLASNFVLNFSNDFNNLTSNIKNLKYYQDKLSRKIRKLEKSKSKEKHASVVADMKELLERINIILPKLEFLKQYFENNIKYFEFDQLIKQVSNAYGLELKKLEGKKILVSELKNISKSNFRSSNYPLLDYINQLNNDTVNVDKNINRETSKYNNLTNNANELKNKLMKLKKIIIADNEYFCEQRELKRVQDEQALAASMFMVGAAAGAITGACIADTPREEVVIIDNTDTYEIITPQEEIIIID